MGIPVEVPGLDAILPEVTEGSVVVIESGADSAKNFFVRRLGLTALRIGQPVTFVISRDRDELLGLFTEEGGLTTLNDHLKIVERDAVNDLSEFANRGGLLAVDSFSLLTLGLEPPVLATMLRGVRARCREKKTSVLLGTDRGMFEPRGEAVVSHLADGVLQFHSREGPEGLVRFLRIPKWTEGRFFDRNIYYEFDGRRIAIDLRSRVL
ncbi:MAG: RAD55 family ATPase [Thermoplasmata archaeon]